MALLVNVLLRAFGIITCNFCFGVWGQGAQDDGLREQEGPLGGFSAGGLALIAYDAQVVSHGIVDRNKVAFT